MDKREEPRSRVESECTHPIEPLPLFSPGSWNLALFDDGANRYFLVVRLDLRYLNYGFIQWLTQSSPGPWYWIQFNLSVKVVRAVPWHLNKMVLLIPNPADEMLSPASPFQAVTILVIFQTLFSLILLSPVQREVIFLKKNILKYRTQRAWISIYHPREKCTLQMMI